MIDKQTEKLLRQLENISTELDDGDHGKNPSAGHIADLLDLTVREFREAHGDED